MGVDNALHLYDILIVRIDVSAVIVSTRFSRLFVRMSVSTIFASDIILQTTHFSGSKKHVTFGKQKTPTQHHSIN